MAGQDHVQVEGRTVEEAIAVAEKQLGRNRDELEIQVIQQPKKGLFGLREQKAVISASIKVTQTESTDENQDKEAVYQDGRVQVTEGQVTVIDPAPDGLAPTIAPGKYVQIFVNGEIIEKATEVSSKDDIIVLAEQVEPVWEPQLRVSQDRLQAFLAIKRTRGMIYEVQDMAPQRELLVGAKLVEEVEPEISLEELKNYLQENNIVYGIIEDNLSRLIESKEEQELLIAQGDPGEPAQDAYILHLYLEEEEEIQEDDEEAVMERVARHAVVSVEPGQLIAEVVPPKPGRPGTDIYGSTISCKPPKEIKLVAGNGVEIDEEGRALALISGRPEIAGSKVLIHPSYVVTGDVDAKVGRIVFKGDVQVLGNVQDEMSIEATGQVVIKGYAAHAVIIAGSNVIIHNNIVGGSVRAGGLGSLSGKITVVIGELMEELPKLLASAKQLMRHPSFAQNRDVARVGEGIILKMLLNKNFAHLPCKLEDSRADLAALVDNLDYEELKIFAEQYEELYHKLSGSGPLTLKTLQLAETIFDAFMERAQRVMEFLEDRAADKADLITGYIQNSHLECSGEVRITGKGCYNSNIYAGGDVIIKGVPGTFRGGEIVTNGNVVIRELGSPAEVATEIRIRPGKSIKADRVYPGVVIYAGTKLERITYEQHGLVLVGQS